MADNSILTRLDGLKLKYEEIGQKLTDPEVIADVKQFIQFNKEYRELEPIIEASERYRTAIANLAEAIDEVINDLESDEWKPGSLVVSTIMEKSNRRLMHFYDAFCKLLRLHYIQSDDLYDGDDNKYDMFLEMIVFIRKTIESIENDREDEAGEFDFSKFED